MNIPFFHHKTKPVIRERADHCVSRANIDPDAIKVLYRLSNAGYVAYLVGGGVRDLLLGRTPKDFDVGTDASPSEIRHIFRNCFLIGRRFRLAHIIFGKKIIETSTFRRQPDEVPNEYGMYQREDNTFGTPEEDAKRRDFTVNGLFYDIRTFAIIDYVGGLKDLEKRVLRSIGDPGIRFQEDPVRMMRAIKFSSRLDFTIERNTQKAIKKYHSEILKASVPRVCEEVYRLFTFRSAQKAFRLAWELGILADLLPDVASYIEANGRGKSPLWRYLEALDQDPDSETASHAVQTACLYYPLFKKAVDTESARLPEGNGRVNRLAISRSILKGISSGLKPPKMTLFSATFLMDAMRRFSVSPKSPRGARFLRHQDFWNALVFTRVILTAEKQDTSHLEPWKEAYLELFPPEPEPKKKAPVRKRHHHSRRSPRKSLDEESPAPESEA